MFDHFQQREIFHLVFLMEFAKNLGCERRRRRASSVRSGPPAPARAPDGRAPPDISRPIHKWLRELPEDEAGDSLLARRASGGSPETGRDASSGCPPTALSFAPIVA